MSLRVTYVISNINKALAFEWIAEEINSKKIELSFVLLNPTTTELELYLKKKGHSVKAIVYRGKRDIPLAILKTLLFLVKQKTQVVHAHLFDANIIGLFAAKLCGIKKRIYTRHHSSYHHQYFPKAVKYDKLCNYLATDIVAITEGVKQLLIEKEYVLAHKVIVIHHGFRLELFETANSINEIQSLKIKYSTEHHYPVIGVISRYTEWKGIQYIIPAFRQLLVSYPNAKLVLANASGDYKPKIQALLKDIPSPNYVEIEFENNIFNLYQVFDVFVHVPIDHHSEAFGQIYVEALAAGIPSVYTLSGIANDFIKDQQNALVVDYKNTDAIVEAVQEIVKNTSLRDTMIKNGKRNVADYFQLRTMIEKLELLYLKDAN